jgi:GntR family transcriptional regulator
MKIMQSDFAPLYQKIANLLEKKIRTGEFPLQSKLPPEILIAKDFGVSLITVRGAMKVLMSKGLVERFPGKGTFVINHSEELTMWGLGSLNELNLTTVKSDMSTLFSKIINLPDWLQKVMGLAVASKINWMRNVRSMNGERFMLSDVYHPPVFSPLIHSKKFSNLLSERKLVILVICELEDIKLGEIRQSLRATLAKGEVAKALNINEGIPLLLIDRIFLDTDGKVIQFGRTHYRVDHYGYELNLRLYEKKSKIRKKTIYKNL